MVPLTIANLTMHPRALTTTVALAMLPIFGCQATAPIHAWVPPRLQSAVGQRVVMASIAGDPTTAKRLGQAIVDSRPREVARQVVLVPQSELQQQTQIQLASAVANLPSDVALLSAARQQGHEYLLIGEILDRSQAGRTPTAPRSAAFGFSSSSAEDDPLPVPATGRDHLTVSWRLMDVGEARLVGGVPVTVSRATVEKLYPDLAALPGAPDQHLTEAAARETWKLLVPYVRRSTVRLAKPYLQPGSGEVRRGNAIAAALRWADAERIWQQVLERHPSNHAALHNLAIAAAARQDFANAKTMAQSALRMYPFGDYERTVVWIEGRQRDMVTAFQLAGPEEGWLFAPN